MFSNQDSLWLRSLIRTFAKVQKVYPVLAAAITLTTPASAWTLSDFIEVVPVDTITERFRIDYVSFAAFSTVTSYEVIYYKGNVGSEIEIGSVRIHPGTAIGGVLVGVPLFTTLIDANTRISVKIASGTAAANTVISSILYHVDEE